MSPHQTSARPKQSLPTFQIALLFLLLVLCTVGIVSSTAQFSQDVAAIPAQEEREFKSTLPDHVPIKVKLKKEPAFKDLKNKGWARDLEIEVTNKGSKPIYFLYAVVLMPDVIVDGNPSGFQMTYGRKELVRLTTPLQPEDIPILPGESASLKIPDSQLRAYEGLKDAEGRPEPRKIRFDLQLLNFGDGTGLRGIDGRPHPNPNKR